MNKKIVIGMTLALAIASSGSSAYAQSVSLAYEFDATNFLDGFFNGTPSPVESVSGSIGFTFTPSSGPLVVYDVVPDFVNLAINGYEYTTQNTLVQITDGDAIAVTLGGAPNAASTGQFTDDFSFTFFISEAGQVLPNLVGGFVVRVQSSSDGWIAVPPDVTVNLVSLDPIQLLDALSEAVAETGAGNSLANILTQARALVEVENYRATCRVLTAFSRAVNAQESGLTIEDAAQILAATGSIRDAIGCE